MEHIYGGDTCREWVGVGSGSGLLEGECRQPATGGLCEQHRAERIHWEIEMEPKEVEQ